MTKQNTFKTKAFTSFAITWTFLVSGLAGLILYISPKGRIANWNVWTMIGLEKDQWAAIHTVMSFLFLILAIIHLFVFNWPVFMAYLNGHQNHFTMLGGQQSARSAVHLAELVRLADRAGLLVDPERAARRVMDVMRVHGIGN